MEVLHKLYPSDRRQAKRSVARRRLQAGLLLGVFLFAPARVSGQATFSEARRFEEGVPVHDVAVTDFDGDGDADLVVGLYMGYDVGPENGSVRWYKNQGLVEMPLARPSHLIAYSSSVRMAWGPTSVAVADFDGDGDGDVAVSRYFFQEDSLSWYENPGETPVGVPGVWSLHEIATLDSRALKAADLDGDGDPDLVALVGRSRDTAIVWYENLVGTPTATQPAETLPAPGSLKVASVWPNPSQGTLTVGYEAPAGEVQVVVFDMLGRQVASRTFQRAAPGKDQIILDLGLLAAGAYVLRLEVDGVRATRQFVLAK